jgi:uncharacterized membrane protein
MSAPLLIDKPDSLHSITPVPLAEVPRNATVDILRGIAVFTMVAANLAGNTLVMPYPFVFRFYGTFAAPMFIMLAGFMVGTKGRYERGVSYYMLRGCLLILIGILIDVLVWQYYPLMSFDVLYLLGVSMPVAFLASRLPQVFQGMLVVLFFAVTPLVESKFGYISESLDLPLAQFSLSSLVSQLPIIARHFFSDGWFPVFPWLGFSLLGVGLASLHHNRAKSFVSLMLVGGPMILSIGIIVWSLNPGPLYVREGYLELFYPPTTGYLLTAVGLLLSMFGLISKISTTPFLKPWQVLGQCSLIIYILHYIIIRYVFKVFWPKVHFTEFIAHYVLLLLVLFGVAYGVSAYKRRFPKNPFLIQFLIGG